MSPRRGISLARIVSVEARQIALTRTSLGPLWTTGEATVDCLNAIAAHIAMRGRHSTTVSLSKSLAASSFLSAAARTAALEYLDIARRHWPESILKRRRAHELVAFAWISCRDRAAAHRWIKQRESWDEYYITFGPKRVPAALEELVRGESKRHKKLQQLAHPSLASLAPSARKTSATGSVQLGVEVFDDQRYARAGLVSAVKIERLLDSMHQTHAIVQGLLRRLFQTSPWNIGARPVRDRAQQLGWRLARDVAHYAEALARLDEHRESNNARIRARQDSRRLESGDVDARLTQFFESDTEDELGPLS